MISMRKYLVQSKQVEVIVNIFDGCFYTHIPEGPVFANNSCFFALHGFKSRYLIFYLFFIILKLYPIIVRNIKHIID